jgi:uncharacterized protein YdaL
VTVILSLGDSLKQVWGQSQPKEAVVIAQPGEAATLGVVNQAEAKQMSRGKLAVPIIGEGAKPEDKTLKQVLERASSVPAVAQGRALILYDAVAGSPTEKFGLAYAIMLSNLLGHFNEQVNLLPINRYTAGSVELYQTTFYLGSHYDNRVPAAFLQDVRRTNRTIVWFKNNLWHLAWNASYDFIGRYGFAFVGMRGFDARPSAENPQPGFFDTITYKSLPFVKFYSYDATANVAYADPDIGIASVLDANKARVWLMATNSTTGEMTPYVVRSGQFWYVADLPFSYIGPRDRYVVFCDLLHDILRQPHHENHRALIRLEDVSAKVEPTSFRQLVNYLSNQDIPFSVALIPTYRDAFGVNNHGVPETIELAQAPNLLNAAKYARQRGGSLVMHGHTHQFNALQNPSGLTGTDWEFWDVLNNAPVPGDSQALLLRRIDAGLSALRAQGLLPFAWETPHYQGSPLAYRAAQKRFNVKYERGTYYTADRPKLAEGDYAVPQFFPYLIKEDFYGHRVIPENLGNVVYSQGETTAALRNKATPAPCGQRTSLSQTDSLRLRHNVRRSLVGNHFALYENARYAWVVRDGFASFFFHPYLVRADSGAPALADLKVLVDGIEKLGYKWAAARSLAERD